jgi:UDP-glucose 4-epimerase
VTLNCGYGRGYSVREVIDAIAPRREGDIVVSVAAADRIRDLLGFRPELDDLDTIVRHALAWERKLMAEREPARRAAIPA